jgi:hypothetical protein
MEDLSVDGRIILKRTLEIYNVVVWTGFEFLGIGTRDGVL